MKIQDITITRGQFLLIRTDGTISVIDQRPTLEAVKILIGADSIDTAAIGRANRTDLVMIVDDAGWDSDVVERPFGIEFVPTRARKPINVQATALYHAICRPGTTHQIAGDVAIAHDSDFAAGGKHG